MFASTRTYRTVNVPVPRMFFFVAAGMVMTGATGFLVHACFSTRDPYFTYDPVEMPHYEEIEARQYAEDKRAHVKTGMVVGGVLGFLAGLL